MFERFTEQARTVVIEAQEEARRLRHNYIGTEHLLLGLLTMADAPAAEVLREAGAGHDEVQARVVAIVASGQEVTSGQIPFTPRAKQVLELALREALQLGHNYIGSAHIVLGLLRGEDGVAMRVLRELGVAAEEVRPRLAAVAAEGLPSPRRLPRAVERLRAHVAGPEYEGDVHVTQSPGVGRLLMSAAARALDDGRTQIELDDVTEALRRREPPEAAAAG